MLRHIPSSSESRASLRMLAVVPQSLLVSCKNSRLHTISPVVSPRVYSLMALLSTVAVALQFPFDCCRRFDVHVTTFVPPVHVAIANRCACVMVVVRV